MGRSCRCWRCQASRGPDPGLFKAGLAGFADGLTSPFVFVVGSDVSDAGVEPYGVVLGRGRGRARVAASSARSVAGSRIANRCGYSALTCLVGRGMRPAEVLGDRAQREELPGRAGGHLRAVVGDGEQDRAGLVAAGVPVPAGSQRAGSWGSDRSGTSLPAPNRTGSPVAFVQSSS